MAKHPNSELTLALDGEVTSKDLAASADAFAKLLDALVESEAPGVDVEWIISDLRPGSALTSALPRTLDPEEDPWIPKIIEAGHRFAEAMERGEDFLRAHPALRQVAGTLRGLVRGRIIRVRFESPERDFVLAGKARTVQGAPNVKPVNFGSVRGRVQAMSKHGSLRFTLYDVNQDRAVSCFLSEGDEEMMLGLWGKLVEVEGWVRRDADGRPITLRGIERIDAIAHAKDWREALGSAKGFLGDEKSEDIIRRGRDE